MTGLRRLEKNSVFYRFASDAGSMGKVEFEGREIAVGDLKQAIADQKGIPKFDLVLVNEATNDTYTRDGAMLPKNMSVTVRRMPPQSFKKPSVVHFEHNDIWSDAAISKIAKKKHEPDKPVVRAACPPEYLCPLCGEIFENPHIARCCGRSACWQCLEGLETNRCPFCDKVVNDDTNPIPNPRLAHSVASLNLEYFVLPVGKGERAAKGRGLVCIEDEEPADHQATGTSLPSTCMPQQLLAPLPSPPSSPFSWPPQSPPPGSLVPCMLSAAQFHMWQHSLRDSEGTESYSESEGARIRRQKKRKDKTKSDRKSNRKNAKKSNGVSSGSSSGEAPQVHKEKKDKRGRKPPGSTSDRKSKRKKGR